MRTFFKFSFSKPSTLSRVLGRFDTFVISNNVVCKFQILGSTGELTSTQQVDRSRIIDPFFINLHKKTKMPRLMTKKFGCIFTQCVLT